MGSLWAPFGCPSWLKFALGTLPEGVRKRIIFKNVVFAPVLRFLLRKPYLGGQDGAQKGPRWDQDGSKTVLAAVFSVFVFDFVFGTILVPFWLPKWLPLGTLFGTKIDQIIDKKVIFKKDPPKTPQEPPREAKKAPKRPPRGQFCRKNARKSKILGFRDDRWSKKSLFENTLKMTEKYFSSQGPHGVRIFIR